MTDCILTGLSIVFIPKEHKELVQEIICRDQLNLKLWDILPILIFHSNFLSISMGFCLTLPWLKIYISPVFNSLVTHPLKKWHKTSHDKPCKRTLWGEEKWKIKMLYLIRSKNIAALYWILFDLQDISLHPNTTVDKSQFH